MRRAALALRNDVAHAVQPVEARLQGVEHFLRGGHLPGFDQAHQRLELVAQVAHRADARHASAALERVYDALQLEYERIVAAILDPRGQGVVRRLQQLRGFLGEDRRDVRIEVRVVFRLELGRSRRRERRDRHRRGHDRSGGSRRRG